MFSAGFRKKRSTSCALRATMVQGLAMRREIRGEARLGELRQRLRQPVLGVALGAEVGKILRGTRVGIERGDARAEQRLAACDILQQERNAAGQLVEVGVAAAALDGDL